jgi:hypothetical protein
MVQANSDSAVIHVTLSPELASWVLRVMAKETARDRPRWARVDLAELTDFLVGLHDALPVRYRTKVPPVPDREGTNPE